MNYIIVFRKSDKDLHYIYFFLSLNYTYYYLTTKFQVIDYKTNKMK